MAYPAYPYIDPFAQGNKALSNLMQTVQNVTQQKALAQQRSKENAFRQQQLAQQQSQFGRELSQEKELAGEELETKKELAEYKVQFKQPQERERRILDYVKQGVPYNVAVGLSDKLYELKPGTFGGFKAIDLRTGGELWSTERGNVSKQVDQIDSNIKMDAQDGIEGYASDPIVENDPFITPEIVVKGAGTPAYIKNTINNIAGWAFGSPIFKDAYVAANTTKAFNSQIYPYMMAGFKKSKYAMEEIKGWLVDPNKAWSDQKLEKEKLYTLFKKSTKLINTRQNMMDDKVMTGEQMKEFVNANNNLKVVLDHLPVKGYKLRSQLENMSKKEIMDFTNSLQPEQKIIFQNNVKQALGK